jgi:hypothetical protein
MIKMIGLTPRILLATVGLFFALPALAQSAPIQSEPIPASSDNRSADVVQQRGPTTKQLNRRAGQYYAERQYFRRAERNARYRADRRAYVRALMNHNRAVNQYDRRYMRKQRAYAQAMAAYRQQVRACHQGYRRACRAPSPRVADFY